MALLSRTLRWPVILGLFWACATGDDSPAGGGADLPANDYYTARLPDGDDALFVEGKDIRRPWGIVEGDTVRVWFTLVTPEEDETPESVAIATVRLAEAPPPVSEDATDGTGAADATDGTEPPVATGAWIGDAASVTVVLDNASEPSVVRTGSGFSMAYVRDGAIGIATSADGLTWSPTDGVLSAAEGWEGATVAAPSLVPDGGRMLLYYLADDGQAVGLAAAPAGSSTFTRLVSAPLFAPSPEPVDDGTDTPDPIWDAAPFDGLSVSGDVTPAGRAIYRVFYSTQARIGFAAGYSPTEWTRSALNPTFIPSKTGTGIREPMRAGPLLLHTRKAQASSARRALGAAVFGLSDSDG